VKPAGSYSNHWGLNGYRQQSANLGHLEHQEKIFLRWRKIFSAQLLHLFTSA